MTLKVFKVAPHQNKELPYVNALLNHGYHICRYSYVTKGVSFGLSDADWRTSFYKPLTDSGVPIFLYPHSTRPMVPYDGSVVSKPVRAMFTIAEGHQKVMARFGYKYPVIPVGWALTPIKTFTPVSNLKSILFAPIHPNGNGYLNEVDRKLNIKTYALLAKFCRSNNIELTIRFCRNIRDNGLDMPFKKHKFFNWVQGSPNGQLREAYDADLIVAHQTYAYMSIAIGKPVLMFGEDIPPRTGNSESNFSYSKNWDLYKDLLMYPLDILNNAHSVEEWIKIAITALIAGR